LPAVDINFSLVAPLIVLAIGALLVLILDLLLPRGSARWPGLVVATGGVLLAGYYLATLWPSLLSGSDTAGTPFHQGFVGAVVVDRFSIAVGGVLLLTALFSVLLSYTQREEELPGFLALMMWSTMGMMTMIVAGNLMTLFLGVEILSLGLYVLVAFTPGNQAGREGALKYLVLGSVATAFFLFGAALLFGETSSTGLVQMHAFVQSMAGEPGIYYKTGIGLLLIGLTFKMALAPFHNWAPDAYQGAPSPVTAFMSAGTKTAAFAAIFRVLCAVLPVGAFGAKLIGPLWALDVLSMFVGSLAAVTQKNIKRLLAYSGVAHAGYMMMALVGLTESGATAGIFYLYAYALMNVGALAVVVYMSELGSEGANISSYKGLVYKRPLLAVAMTLFMLSLTGMPPAAGFIGKLRLLQATLEQGGVWLVAALVLTNGISAFAYLRVVFTMFARNESDGAQEQVVLEAAVTQDVHARNLVAPGLVIALTSIGTVVLGVYPQPVMQLLVRLLPFS
jgi:NADH-quinone oxidoreductase subunit N